MTVSSVERPVSALRQRMLEDMAMRGLRSDTQRKYISFVRDFAAFLGRAPDTATAEDVRRFHGSASLCVETGLCCARWREAASFRMTTAASWAPAPNQTVLKVDREDHGWTVSVDSHGDAACPLCGTRSRSRHGSYRRSLQDLPAQGQPVMVRARVTRWRCRNAQCERRTFAACRPDLTAPFARRTTRMTSIVRLFGHGACGAVFKRETADPVFSIGCVCA